MPVILRCLPKRSVIFVGDSSFETHEPADAISPETGDFYFGTFEEYSPGTYTTNSKPPWSHGPAGPSPSIRHCLPCRTNVPSSPLPPGQGVPRKRGVWNDASVLPAPASLPGVTSRLRMTSSMPQPGSLAAGRVWPDNDSLLVRDAFAGERKQLIGLPREQSRATR